VVRIVDPHNADEGLDLPPSRKPRRGIYGTAVKEDVPVDQHAEPVAGLQLAWML